MVNKMKKVLIGLIIVISTLCLTACMGPKTYEEISYGELQDKINYKDDFILFIGAETCSACKAYKHALNKAIENYGIDVKYIDIDKISDDQLADLKSIVYFSGTPQTVFITNGKNDENKKKIDGNVKYSKLVKTLEKYGYIKEK